MSGPPLPTSQAGRLTLGSRAASEPMEVRAYRLLTRLARPAAPYILRWRERRGKEDATRLGERMGRPSAARPDGSLVWVHAASVGETSAVLPLINRLTERQAPLTVLLTTGTVTSARFSAGRLGARTLHQYVPLDEPGYVATFLDHWRPNLAVLTEQEVWPNMVLEAAERGIPLALVNGRMSDRSFERWSRRPGLARALFSRFAVVLAQNEALALRFAAMGAPRVLTSGNLKVDAPAPPVEPAAFRALEASLAGRPRLVAASTHEGEEALLAEVYPRLAARHPGLVLIIAPRHPERGARLMAELAQCGRKLARRSTGALPGAGTELYIADTMGELGTLYAATEVAFIGGSLVTHGGQNPIEAVRHGAVVVAGPSTYNFSDAYDLLVAAGGAMRITQAPELAPVLGDLIGSASRRQVMREAANGALSQLSGALERTAGALMPYIGDVGAERAPNGVG